MHKNTRRHTPLPPQTDTYIHIHTDTYIHTNTHARTHVHSRAHTRTHTHTLTHTHTHIHTHTHSHKCTHSLTHTHTHTHPHTHTHACMHARIHTHTHTSIPSCSFTLIVGYLISDHLFSLFLVNLWIQFCMIMAESVAWTVFTRDQPAR